MKCNFIKIILFTFIVASEKQNLSLGMLDDRTGFSLLSYTYNVKQTEMNEYFVGAGTMMLAFTGSVGWKHYYIKSKLSLSSVLSAQYVMHMGFMGFLPMSAFTLEYDLNKSIKVKVGTIGGVLLGGTSKESGGDAVILPFVGFDFKF